MPRRGQERDVYERDEVEYDRQGRRGRGPDTAMLEADIDRKRTARGPPPVDELEREPERRRSPPPLHRRTSSAGPMVARSRLGENHERRPQPREVDRVHEHEEIHLPRGHGRRSPGVDIERDEMHLRRDKSRPRGNIVEEDEYIRRGMEDYRLGERSARSKFRDNEPGGELVRGGRPDRRPDEFGGRVSYERERSRPRGEVDEMIIGREDRRRGRGRGEDEVYIRRETDRSPSSESSVTEAPHVQAPPIHQDVVTHHKHVEHGKSIKCMNSGTVNELTSSHQDTAVRNRLVDRRISMTLRYAEGELNVLLAVT